MVEIFFFNRTRKKLKPLM
ncbi:UNVERIFIED_CONTAM: hypothetical protein GTU68_007277 [Idotea baltica]|nr:hypothetical protein [Idotea baltica]